jgi:glycosyltransferase involved in cell wall biosynthesis
MTASHSVDRRVKVCIVGPVPPPYGGMSIQAQKLAARLDSGGVEVQLLSTNPTFPGMLRALERVPGLRTVMRTLIYVRSLNKVMPDTDVFHHMTVCGLYFFFLSVPLVFWGRLCRKRVVLNYRGGRAASFLKKWSWAVIPVMRMAHAVIVPSAFLQRTFRKHGLAAQVVPNIIDIEAFPYQSRKSFRPKLIVTRHLEPLYNIECILRAFRIVKEKFCDAELSILGTGPEERRLQRLCAEWKLQDVTFNGDIAPAKLPALYAAHDIFVNSSNADNFPAALVEAACSGLPIVTTCAGGIPDMIRDGENGILVGLNDHEALAAKVIELVENPEMARRLAEDARTWAEQFSWSTTFAALLQNYGLTAIVVDDESPIRARAGSQHSERKLHSDKYH